MKTLMRNKVVANVVCGLVIYGIAAKMLKKRKPTKITIVDCDDDENYEKQNTVMEEMLNKMDEETAV